MPVLACFTPCLIMIHPICPRPFFFLFLFFVLFCCVVFFFSFEARILIIAVVFPKHWWRWKNCVNFIASLKKKKKKDQVDRFEYKHFGISKLENNFWNMASAVLPQNGGRPCPVPPPSCTTPVLVVRSIGGMKTTYSFAPKPFSSSSQVAIVAHAERPLVSITWRRRLGHDEVHCGCDWRRYAISVSQPTLSPLWHSGHPFREDC